MFILLSIFAASIDGFVSGIVAGGAGIKMDFNNCIKVFVIIFICCVAVSLPGDICDTRYVEKYIGYVGAALMFYLSGRVLLCEDEEKSHTGIISLAFYTALDAAVLCVYLVLEGYSIFAISFLSAFLHSALMATGAKLTNILIKSKREMYTKHISAVLFAIMGFYKLYELI